MPDPKNPPPSEPPVFGDDDDDATEYSQPQKQKPPDGIPFEDDEKTVMEPPGKK